MTLHHTLYRKMTILIPTLPQVPEYAKSQVPGHRPPISGTGIRSIPNGPIPTDTRFTPVQPLSQLSPLAFTRARRQTVSKFGTEGRFMARKLPDSRPEDSRL
jgi:hypothetical protein